MITSAYTATYMKKLAELGCPWHFGVDDPEALMARYGWQGTMVMPGEPDAHFGRWRYPVIPRNVPGIPRPNFVHARPV